MIYKNKLGESVKRSSRQSALLNEVVERGQAWRQRAKANESNTGKYHRRFMLASEALQQLAMKYKSDVTELGRRVIQLEFKDKATTPAIQKMLKEATTPRHIVEIRAVLEGKSKLNSPTAEPAGVPGKVNETKVPVSVSPKVPVNEGVTVISAQPSDPRQLNEAVAMVGRLSKAMVS